MPLDPYLAHRLATAPDLAPHEIFTGDPELIARALEAFGDDRPYTPPTVHSRDLEIPGPNGPFRVRVYTPDTDTSQRALLVWSHGGGFVGGSIDDAEGDLVSREVASRGDVVVVSVDYHLANGTTVTYPQLHQEVAATIRWAQDNASELGTTSESIAVGGASAGGNLSVAACLELRSLGLPLPAAMVLAYPLLHRELPVDDEVAETCEELPAVVRFPKPTLDFFLDAYLGGQGTAPFVTPEGHDLAGLPRCVLVVAQYDELRSSGQAFAEKAEADGLEVALLTVEGLTHGFLGMTPHTPGTDTTLQLIAETVAGLDG